jgi:N-acetylglutamate synthase-like GNAT family acetyltransferase
VAHKDIVVRPPESREASQIARLLHAHRCAHLVDRESDILVAELDGMVLGTIAARRVGEEALVHTYVVENSLRGKGVEDALVGGLVKRAKLEGVKRLWVLPHVASGDFAAHGFSVARMKDCGHVQAFTYLRRAPAAVSPAIKLDLAAVTQ